MEMQSQPHEIPRFSVILVAGGTGSRTGLATAKQYAILEGISVLKRSITAFLRLSVVQCVQVVIHRDHRALYDEAVTMLAEDARLLPPVVGGETRQASVYAGLEALKRHAPTHVLIHDAARCLVSNAVIQRVFDALMEYDAVVPALPVVDTLRDVVTGNTAPREGLLRIQTPQAFVFDTLCAAYADVPSIYTDDAAVWLAAGRTVHYVDGAESNFKITTLDDFSRAEQYLQRTHEIRTAMGYDVHRLVAHQSGQGNIILGGLEITHSHYLEGHSDADVVLHALTDALLGTIAAGDIGQHFSPSDARWKDADSSQFVRYACGLLALEGGQVMHVDITIMCEAPKIAPLRDAMRARIAAILNVPMVRISVKATTTEGLGFTGRGEGIAAHAVVTAKFFAEQMSC